MTSDKYNSHQISLGKCSAVLKCGRVGSLPTLPPKKPAVLASRTLPPKPDSGKLPALEKPPPPRNLPILSRSSSPPLPRGQRGAGRALRAPRTALCSWLLPAPHRPLAPHVPGTGAPRLGSRSGPGQRLCSGQRPQAQPGCPAPPPLAKQPLPPGFWLCTLYLSSSVIWARAL